MKIGDRIYVRGYIDEIRKDTVIVRNDGGYFGTTWNEVTPSAQPDVPDTNVGDMISRQAAIDALGERPMVWTSDDDYALGERNQYDIDRLAIETVPSVDAVDVVRCKDCKKYDNHNHRCKHWNHGIVVMDYCSRGERKDG